MCSGKTFRRKNGFDAVQAGAKEPLPVFLKNFKFSNIDIFV